MSEIKYYVHLEGKDEICFVGCQNKSEISKVLTALYPDMVDEFSDKLDVLLSLAKDCSSIIRLYPLDISIFHHDALDIEISSILKPYHALKCCFCTCASFLNAHKVARKIINKDTN